MWFRICKISGNRNVGDKLSGEHKYTICVLKLLVRSTKTVISFPSVSQALSIMDSFEARFLFQGALYCRIPRMLEEVSMCKGMRVPIH